MINTVSIAMTTYNGEKFLVEQLNSLLYQTYPIYEIIICDDCSTDGTIAILREFQKKHNKLIKIHSNEINLGYIKNFEKALSLCSGDFIALCDQDDIWDNNKINDLLLHIGTNDAIHSDARLIDAEGEIISNSFTNFSNKKVNNTSILNLCMANIATGCTLMIKKEIVTKSISFPIFFPHDHWLALLATAGNGISYYPKSLISYRQHESNVIGAHQSKAKKNMLSLLRAIKYLIKRRNSSYSLIYNRTNELLKISFLLDKDKKDIILLNNFCKKVIFPEKTIQFCPFLQSFKYFNNLIKLDNDYFIIPIIRTLSLFYTPKLNCTRSFIFNKEKNMIKKLIMFIKNILPYGIIKPLIDKKDKKKFLSLSIPESEEPVIYNSNGTKMSTFFLKDEMCRHQPYSFVSGRYPQNIHWDRYNYGLKTHFYTHRFLTERLGHPDKQFAYLIESESIVPHHYKVLLDNPGLALEFNKVFTHSEKLLDSLPNAAFLPGGGVWYGTKIGGGEIKDDGYINKTKNISLVSSNLQKCELHKFRMQLANYFSNDTKVDTFGTFNGGKNILISESLTNYRYSIVIENHISKYWFTEKILNCFASFTIPIYFGAKGISDFFNPDGIIFINNDSIEKIENILQSCNEADYLNRENALIDNYARVQKFLCIEDYLFENFNDILR